MSGWGMTVSSQLELTRDGVTVLSVGDEDAWEVIMALQAGLSYRLESLDREYGQHPGHIPDTGEEQ